MEKEIWKPIYGYVHHYAISSWGNVRSFKKGINNLVVRYKSNGYAQVCLCKNKKLKYFHVHRLVALAFIPNPDRKPQLNHKDLNKKNCRVDNLEWNTGIENQRHARAHIKYKLNPKRGIEHKKSCPLVQMSLNGQKLFIWENQTKACKYYGASIGAISTSLRRTKVAFGYRWEATTKEYYLKNKHLFGSPPSIIKSNLKTRDLSKAFASRMKNINAITAEFILNHGVLCYKKYGNIIRPTFEKYARENKIGGYRYVIRRFGKYDNFKEKVFSNFKEKVFSNADRLLQTKLSEEKQHRLTA